MLLIAGGYWPIERL
ncbi:hypothetical protein YPPY32_2353, partial [Yersinia pestis PY-32]